MFIHIGNNYLLRKDEIIAAFCVQAMGEDPKGRKFLNDIRASDRLVDISDGKWASVIITDGPIYVSRISTSTLKSRSGGDIDSVLTSERRPTKKKSAKKAKTPKN